MFIQNLGYKFALTKKRNYEKFYPPPPRNTDSFTLIQSFKRFLFLLAIILLINGCSDSSKYDPLPENQESSNLRTSFPIKLKFIWESIWTGDPTSNPCYTPGVCGACPGICIYFGPWIAVSQLTQQEIAEGIGIGTINLIQNDTKLSMICSTTPDNGNGYTIILNNWTWPSEIANEFGYDSLVIKSGTYAVNYNNYPNGRVDFNVEVY